MRVPAGVRSAALHLWLWRCSDGEHGHPRRRASRPVYQHRHRMLSLAGQLDQPAFVDDSALNLQLVSGPRTGFLELRPDSVEVGLRGVLADPHSISGGAAPSPSRSDARGCYKPATPCRLPSSSLTGWPTTSLLGNGWRLPTVARGHRGPDLVDRGPVRQCEGVRVGRGLDRSASVRSSARSAGPTRPRPLPG